jgi:S-adenosylmethionine decarboxylase
METVQFGFHLTLDLYGCPLQPLNHMPTVYDSLDKLPKKIGMTALIPPYVIHADANDAKDPGGYTGFLIIQESHISVHSFAKRGFVSIDVYSCKTFDVEKTKKHFVEIFQPTEVEEHFLNRGVNYPVKDLYE